MEETLRSTVGRAAEVPRNRRHSDMAVKYSNAIVTHLCVEKISAFYNCVIHVPDVLE
jgi:hypothetical protein